MNANKKQPQPLMGQRDQPKLTWGEWEKEVAEKLDKYFLIPRTRKGLRLAKKLFNQGYSTADAVGIIILNS